MRTNIHFFVISRSVLRMRNVSGKILEKIKTRILVQYLFFFENLTVYEKMWKNTVEQGGAQLAIWRMRIACWIAKATNTHSGCVTLITFPLQQWLLEPSECYVTLTLSCLVFICVSN